MSTIVQKITDKLEQHPFLSQLEEEHIVAWADELGEFLVQQNLTKTQIRKFLDAVIRVKNFRGDTDYRAQAMLMKPKLAYAVGRTKDERKGINPVEPLMKVLSPCIDRIHDQNDFERLAQFVEAIVAYHKYYGGKD